MRLFGTYDVVVVGAGAAGIVAALRAAREGARTLVVEGSGGLGGLLTGGRLTKPTGLINGGIFREMLARCAAYGGADDNIRTSYWGQYTGAFDAEVLQRVLLECVDEAKLEYLLNAHVTEAVMEGDTLKGLLVHTKSGISLIQGKVFVDASGDGDLAVFAGADFMLGRRDDGKTQPITSYFRLLNVDIPAFVADCKAHADDMWEFVAPDGVEPRNESYVMAILATGFTKRIQAAEQDGFKWIIPKNHMTVKTGLIPGEVSVNVTRFHGNALDDRTLSRAEIEIRRQAYCAFEFLKRYVDGFKQAIFLEVAPKLGVRETRRIKGRYVLTEADVRGQARFDDAIGLCNSPVDIHEPGGDRAIMDNIGSGYGIPYRCMLPEKVRGLLVAGRCISVDEVAYGSTRNVPGCAMTGEAAGVAAAICAKQTRDPGDVDIKAVQARLRDSKVTLGVPGDR